MIQFRIVKINIVFTLTQTYGQKEMYNKINIRRRHTPGRAREVVHSVIPLSTTATLQKMESGAAKRKKLKEKQASEKSLLCKIPKLSNFRFT